MLRTRAIFPWPTPSYIIFIIINFINIIDVINQETSVSP
jgi:hypothetical protein